VVTGAPGVLKRAGQGCGGRGHPAADRGPAGAGQEPQHHGEMRSRSGFTGSWGPGYSPQGLQALARNPRHMSALNTEIALVTVDTPGLHGHRSFQADRGAKKKHQNSEISGRLTRTDRGHSAGPRFFKTQPNRAARTALDSPSLAARVPVLSARFGVRSA
jgi:hypothetical protein